MIAGGVDRVASETQRVLDNDIDPVNVITGLRLIGAVRDMRHLHRQILRRARLHDGFQIDIALPVFAAVTLLRLVTAAVRIERVVGAALGRVGAVDVAAADVAGHEVQAGNAQGAEVEVVARLPGAFVGAVEIGVFDRVGEVDRVAADEIERCVAIDLLPAEHYRVGAEGVFAGEAERGVVDGAGQRSAGVAGDLRGPAAVLYTKELYEGQQDGLYL